MCSFSGWFSGTVKPFTGVSLLFVYHRNVPEGWHRNSSFGYEALRERMEALAALHALRENAADAIPALQRLMAENLPDPRALYVIARTGKAGLPVLRGALTSQEKILRLESQICLDMIETHSGVLYADIDLGSEAATFQQRICLFNAETLRAAAQEYRDQHPNE
jgi:hypothetical protein